MENAVYLKIEGETQGLISDKSNTLASLGNSFIDSHKDEILVSDIYYGASRPYDAEKRIITGESIHHPLTVTKTMDRCTPLLYQALIKGENLKECEFKFYRTNMSGDDELFYKITLNDALLIDMGTIMPQYGVLLDQMKFTFRSIKIDHIKATTVFVDDRRQKDGKD